MMEQNRKKAMERKRQREQELQTEFEEQAKKVFVPSEAVVFANESESEIDAEDLAAFID